MAPRRRLQQQAGPTRTLDAGVEGRICRTVLPNGVRVITEQMPSVRSVSFGIWLGVGARDEAPAEAGASHYLEHLLFKGTRKRDALEIASAMDAVGGEMNAFTTKEYTCYYARVLDNDLPLGVDLVSDMVTASVLRPADVDNERGVILEEIAMHEDDPGDLVHDLFAATIWPTSPLGRPVVGTVDSIGGMTREAISGYYRRTYTPERTVVSAAGNVEHDRLLELLGELWADAPPGTPEAGRAGGPRPPFTAGVRVERRPTEQANLVLGTTGVARTDPRRFALGVLNGALGGGMSSRLFQEVRERRGLVYSVYSFSSQYSDTGLFGIYAGCLPAKVDEVLGICRAELANVVQDGISEAELARGKGQLRGGFVLGLEDTGSRMSRLAKSELVYGELLTVGEVLERIERVSMQDLRTVAQEVLAGPLALSLIGPFEDRDFSSAVA